MAVNTFLKEVWEARLIANFHKRSIMDLISTKPTSIEGSKVHFGSVGAVAIKDYTGSVDYDELNVGNVDLVFNKKKYFAIKVDDVDKIQAAGDLLDAHVVEASASMAEVIDTDGLKAIVDGALAANKLGNKDVHQRNAYDLIVDLGTKLNKAKASKTDRFAIIDAEYLGLLSKDPRFTNNPNILENGVVEGQKINGAQVIVSEELPSSTDGTRRAVIVLQRTGFGYGKQLDKIEALRLEGSFGDAVRGLCNYGATVLIGKSIATAMYKIVPVPAIEVKNITSAA